MSNLSEEFKKLVFRKEVPDDGLLVPLMRWLSGKESNIETIQKVNKRFTEVNRKINIRKLTLTNTVTNFLRYPKAFKEDKELEFFYKDLAKYFGWTTRELRTNLEVIDLDELKPVIAKAFGYEDVKLKKLGLRTIKQRLRDAERQRDEI